MTEGYVGASKPLICLLSLGVALVAPATLSAKIVRQVERTFSVQAGGELLAQKVLDLVAGKAVESRAMPVALIVRDS